MITQPELGQRIGKLRRDRGISQAQMAVVIGVARSTLAGYERGHITPSTDVLIQISAYFDMTLNQLLGISESPNNNNGAMDLYAIIERLYYNVSRGEYRKYRRYELTDFELKFLEMQLKQLSANMEYLLKNR